MIQTLTNEEIRSLISVLNAAITTEDYFFKFQRAGVDLSITRVPEGVRIEVNVTERSKRK